MVVGGEREVCPVVVPQLAADAVPPHLWDNTITFYINGVEYSVTNPDPTLHLVDFIRDTAMLKATKVCGAMLLGLLLCPCAV